MFTQNNKNLFKQMSEALEGKSRFTLDDIEFMRDLYVNEKIGVSTISEMMGCSAMNVKNLLKRRGVQIRSPLKKKEL